MAAELQTERQRMAVAVAQAEQLRREDAETCLREAVRVALSLGVPILTLSQRLGVSRSRIRRLAR